MALQKQTPITDSRHPSANTSPHRQPIRPPQPLTSPPVFQQLPPVFRRLSKQYTS